MQPSTQARYHYQEGQTFEEEGEDKRSVDHIDSPFPVLGGVELGSYLFFANCLQVVGLQTVESDRAGFLVQLTTVIVPIMEAMFAGNILAVPVRTWIACLLAFLGVIVMGLENGGDSGKIAGNVFDHQQLWGNFDGIFNSFTQGEALIIGAAVLYSLHVVRLSGYARATTPLKLAAAKATTESLFSILLVVSLTVISMTYANIGVVPTSDSLVGFVIQSGNDIRTFLSSFTHGISKGTLSPNELIPALGAVLWTGWVTCSYTIWAQSFGQARIRYLTVTLLLLVRYWGRSFDDSRYPLTFTIYLSASCYS
jgi:hypothetical protein